MPWSSYYEFTSFSSDSSNGGTVAWNNPSNAQSDDGSYADTGTLSTTVTTEYLKALQCSGISTTGWGMITEVEVQVQHKAGTANNLSFSRVSLVLEGTVQTEDASSQDPGTWGVGDTEATFSFTSDIPDVPQADDTNFGVVVEVSNVEEPLKLGNPQIDRIRVRFFYPEFLYDEAIGVADVVTLGITRALVITDDIGIADDDTFDHEIGGNTYSLVVPDDLGVAENLIFAIDWAKLFKDGIGLSDTVITAANKTLLIEDNVGLSTVVNTAVGRSLEIADAIAVADETERNISFASIITDSIGAADDALKSIAWRRLFPDNVGIGDQTLKATEFFRDIPDNIGLDDYYIDATSYKKLYTEAIGLADVDFYKTTYHRLLPDNVGIADDISTKTSYNKTYEDAIGINGSTGSDLIFNQTETTAIGLADQILAAVAYLRSPESAIGLADRVVTAIDIAFSDTSGIGLADVVQLKMLYTRSNISGFGLADTYALATEYLRSILDSIGIADTFDTTAAYKRNPDDAIGIADIIQFITIGPNEIFNRSAIGVADDLLTEVEYLRDESNGVGIADNVVIATTFWIHITDAIGVADLPVYATSYARLLDDAIGIADLDNAQVFFSANIAAPPPGQFCDGRILGRYFVHPIGSEYLRRIELSYFRDDIQALFRCRLYQVIEGEFCIYVPIGETRKYWINHAGTLTFKHSTKPIILDLPTGMEAKIMSCATIGDTSRKTDTSGFVVRIKNVSSGTSKTDVTWRRHGHG